MCISSLLPTEVRLFLAISLRCNHFLALRARFLFVLLILLLLSLLVISITEIYKLKSKTQ